MSKDSMSDHKTEYYMLNAKLCRLVQANPCMYDRSAPNYLKKDFVERAWANIAREVNDTEHSEMNQQELGLLENSEVIDWIETVDPPRIITVETEREYHFRKLRENREYRARKKQHIEEIRGQLVKVVSCKERWRNVRTAYARSVNIYKSPGGPNRHKRYYLHDELQFLTKHIAPGLPSIPIRVLDPAELEEMHENSRQTIDITADDSCTFQINLDSSSSPPALDQDPNSEPEAEPEQDQEPEPEPEREREPEPEPEHEPINEESPPQSKKRRRNIISDEPPKEIVIRPPKRNPDFDFLQSLLPEMKIMNSRQKILFKGKIFQALEEVFSDSKDYPQKKDESFVSQSSFASTPAPTRSLSRQHFGNKVFAAERRDKMPESQSKNLRGPIMVQLAHPQNESVVVKVENENVEVFVEE